MLNHRTNHRVLPIFIVAMLAMTMLMGIEPAHGQSGSFGIQPASGDPKQPYFTFEAKPGDLISDAIIAKGAPGASLSLQLYAADGITASGGGTAFTAKGTVRSGDSSWLTLSTTDLALSGDAEVRIPFTVKVPADAKPGDHVAGIVAEAPPKSGSAGGVQTSIVERVGVAVVVHVAGDAVRKLTLGDFCLNQATGSNYFEIAARNAGTLLIRGTATFELRTVPGEHVFARTLEVGAILPGDGTAIRIHAPQYAPPGEYVALVTVETPDAPPIAAQSKIVVPEEKIDGCAVDAVAGSVDDGSSGDNFNIPGVSGLVGGDLGSGGIAIYLLAGMVALLTIVVIMLLVRDRRPRDQK